MCMNVVGILDLLRRLIEWLKMVLFEYLFRKLRWELSMIMPSDRIVSMSTRFQKKYFSYLLVKL